MSNQPPFKKSILSVAVPGISELISIGQKKAEDEAGIVREKSDYGKSGEINMNCSPAEKELALRIAIRGRDFMAIHGVKEDVLTSAMDITAVHLNYQPLRLLAFALTSDVADFAHDYSRIRMLINRTTGRLPEGTELKFAEKPDATH